VVASHYDNLPEKGREQRHESRIYHMRNFNNWIKSTLINEYLEKVKQQQTGAKVQVLDLGCGKGGDLQKWHRAKVDKVVGVDIAGTSIEQCKDRYHEMRGRNNGRIFAGEFHAVDCTKERIKDFLEDKEIQFDIVSCQFAFHYCFESLSQAECMLKNVSDNLRPGGFFIGTTPDANDIMARLENNGGNRFGNSLFSVTFDQSIEGPQPLFGAQYQFHLEEVVDCPEFLVHFPTFTKLAEKFGLLMIGKQRFQNYFQQRKEQPEAKLLLQRMNALESWKVGETQLGEEEDYKHMEGVETGGDKVGTLSRDEWEALTIYTVFVFKKMRL